MNRRYVSFALVGVVVFTLVLYAATGISQQDTTVLRRSSRGSNFKAGTSYSPGTTEDST